MATTSRPRPQPCLHCGDTVLVVASSARGLGGLLKLKDTVRLEHADPSPTGELFDPVDDGCHRPPVRRGPR